MKEELGSEVAEHSTKELSVSLLMMTYNQENHVAAAVRSVLVQRASELEIIISDDCSTDNTFEKIKSLTAEYNGPHSIRVVRRERNLGLIPHFNALVSEASGDIIVLAAGDDVSLSHRVSMALATFEAEEDTQLLHSDAATIDDKGRPIGVQKPPVIDDSVTTTDLAAAGSIYIGATGAFRKSLWRKFGPITEQDAFEDLVMGFRAKLLGGLRYIPEGLVQYRVDIGLSSYAKRETSFSALRLRHAEIMAATLRQREMDVRAVKLGTDDEILNKIVSSLKTFEQIIVFHTSNRTKKEFLSLLQSKANLAFAVKELIRYFRFSLRNFRVQ